VSIQPGQPITAAFLNSLAPQISVVPGQTISSTSPAGVGSVSFPVVNGTTYIGYAWLTLDANSGGTAEFRWTGPATPTQLGMGILTQQLNTADAYQQGTTESATGYNSGFLDTPTLATTLYIVQLWIIIEPSASGTLALICANAAGGSDTFSLGLGYVSLQQQLT
jgi:hypothetical protein